MAIRVQVLIEWSEERLKSNVYSPTCSCAIWEIGQSLQTMKVPYCYSTGYEFKNQEVRSAQFLIQRANSEFGAVQSEEASKQVVICPYCIAIAMNLRRRGGTADSEKSRLCQNNDIDPKIRRFCFERTPRINLILASKRLCNRKVGNKKRSRGWLVALLCYSAPNCCKHCEYEWTWDTSNFEVSQ